MGAADITRAYSALANTLTRGFAAKGANALATSRAAFETQRAGREDERFALQKPGMMAQSMEAKAKLKRGLAPVTDGMIYNNLAKLEIGMANMDSATTEILGPGVRRTDSESERYINEDGSVVTVAQYEARGKETYQFFFTSGNVDKYMQSVLEGNDLKRRGLQDKLEAPDLSADGADAIVAEMDALEAENQATERKKNDPVWKRAQTERLLNLSLSTPGQHAANQVPRHRADIAGYDKLIAANKLRDEKVAAADKKEAAAVKAAKLEREHEVKLAEMKDTRGAHERKVAAIAKAKGISVAEATDLALSKKESVSPIGKLFAERDALPIESNEERKLYNDRIERLAQGKTNLTGVAKEYFDVYGEKPTTTEQLREFKEATTAVTKEERDTKAKKLALPKIQEIDPNDAYARGWKMNDDGSVFTELDTGAPVKLPNFDKVMGKRGMTRAVLEAGEQLDDAREVSALLKDPEVMKGLRAAENAGMWDIATGAWSNKVRGWLQKHGYAQDSKVTETIIRIGRMTSRERKQYLGTAVTATELQSVRSWMTDIGDSFDLMVAKINVAVEEGDEIFMRFLDTYKDSANMSPFYRAFGKKRFGEESGDSVEVKALKDKYGLD